MVQGCLWDDCNQHNLKQPPTIKCLSAPLSCPEYSFSSCSHHNLRTENGFGAAALLALLHNVQCVLWADKLATGVFLTHSDDIHIHFLSRGNVSFSPAFPQEILPVLHQMIGLSHEMDGNILKRRQMKTVIFSFFFTILTWQKHLQCFASARWHTSANCSAKLQPWGLGTERHSGVQLLPLRQHTQLLKGGWGKSF